MRGVFAAAGRRVLGTFLLFAGGLGLVWAAYGIFFRTGTRPVWFAGTCSASPHNCHPQFGWAPVGPIPASTAIAMSVVSVVCIVAALLIHRPRRSSAYVAAPQ